MVNIANETKQRTAGSVVLPIRERDGERKRWRSDGLLSSDASKEKSESEALQRSSKARSLWNSIGVANTSQLSPSSTTRFLSESTMQHAGSA